MKTIGLIGGMSWESTIPYYQIINNYIKNELGGLHSAKILVSSIDFYYLEKLQRSQQWVKAGNLILKEAVRLQNAGSDFLVICSNTGNECTKRIAVNLKIPILHIAEATGQEVKNNGYKKVGLLGTIYTMEKEYMKSILTKSYGLDIVVPQKQDRKIINNVIYQELCQGVMLPKSREEYIRIIEKMKKEHNIEAIILGCTEISLLINQKDVQIPLFDTTKIHALAAAKYALK